MKDNVNSKKTYEYIFEDTNTKKQDKLNSDKRSKKMIQIRELKKLKSILIFKRKLLH